MGAMKRLIFLLCFLWAFPVWATDYYVKTGGDDGLSGLDDANAWATPAKVEATATSGDTVYFRSQDTWTRTSTIPVLTSVAGVTYDGATYGSGTRAKFQATGTISVATGSHVVRLDTSNVTFKGFEIDGADQYATSGIGVGRMTQNSISTVMIDNCLVRNIGAGTDANDWCRGITVGPGYQDGDTVVVSNVTIKNSTVHTTLGGAFVVYPTSYDAPKTVDTVLIQNCTAYNTGRYAAYVSRGYGVDIKNGCDNVTVEYCNLYSNGYNGIHIETVTEAGESVGVGVPQNVIVRYNIIKDSGASGIMINNIGNRDGLSGSFYGNLLINNGKSGVNFGVDIKVGRYLYGSSTFNFYNNTIYSTANTSSYPHSILIGNHDAGLADTPTINFKNNIVISGTYTAIVDKNNRLTHANNLIYRTSSATDEHVDDGTSRNRAGVLTWEATAQNTLPAFTGGTLPTGFSGTYGTDMVPNTTYFSLPIDSPAVNTGATLGAPYNGSINGAALTVPVTRPQGAGYDIGAYEFFEAAAQFYQVTIADTATYANQLVDCANVAMAIGLRLTGAAKVNNYTIARCPGGGIVADESATINNTIASSISIAAGKTVTGSHNLFTASAKSGDGTYTDAGGTLWESDPLFISSSDLRLQPTSPAVRGGAFVAGVHDQPGCADAAGIPCNSMAIPIGAYSTTTTQPTLKGVR